ncbi:MAG: aminotransferase class V-fold PLP-dependent enzyme [Bacteroidales bacterium]
MKTVNFGNGNSQFTLLSEGVRIAIDEANKLSELHKFDGFGNDLKIKANTILARQDITGFFKLNPGEVFFNHGIESADIEIINQAILFLKVKTIVTAQSERKSKTSHLERLNSEGIIKLIYQNSFSTETLSQLFSESFSPEDLPVLVTFSHANIQNGKLLPIKEIIKICRTNFSYFHLDVCHTVGRYPLSFDKLCPDFVTFDCGLTAGLHGIGITIMYKNTNTDDNQYRNLSENLKTIENKNFGLIMGIFAALKSSFENLETNKIKIQLLINYIIHKFKEKLNLEPFFPNKESNGLFTLAIYQLKRKEFGEFLFEKLDMKGIAIQNPEINGFDDTENYTFSLVLNENFTEAQIDTLVDALVSIKMQNI